ncbi:MAG: hypothetical protein ABIQ99_02595 [Thermoflexales bacterium]
MIGSRSIPTYRRAPAGFAAPHPPAEDTPGVQVWSALDGSAAVIGHELDGRCWLHFPGLASVSFTRSGDAAELVSLTALSPEEQDDVYYRRALPFILQARGREVLHASAVRLPHGVLALCGPSGAGKSTLARALGGAGYSQWADDVVLLEVSPDAVETRRLPFDIRLLPDAVAHFAARPGRGREGAGAGSEPGPEGEQGSDPDPAPLAAVCILETADRDREHPALTIRRLGGSAAFEALLANAFAFTLNDTERRARMMHHYLALSERVPVFRVRLPAGLDHLPHSVARIVAATTPIAARDHGSTSP